MCPHVSSLARPGPPASGGAEAGRALSRRGVLALATAAACAGLAAWAPAPRARLERLVAAWRAGAGTAAFEPYLRLLERLAGLDVGAQLTEVNAFFQRSLRFRSDDAVWGEADHWASPLELLRRGEGDCEDFAIAKYFSLLLLGVPEGALRLVYVRARMDAASTRSYPHMVLAWLGGEHRPPLILDNLVDEVLALSRRGELAPVFSFSRQGLWSGLGDRRLGDPATRLPRWPEVLRRAQREGFV